MRKKEFTAKEIEERIFLRVSRVIFELWEEGGDAPSVNTRILDWLVPSNMVHLGVSKKGGGHREHVVPCLVIIVKALEMFDSGSSISEVAAMIQKFLKIVEITPEEAYKIDSELGLKQKMPEGWDFESGDVLARLNVGGVEVA